MDVIGFRGMFRVLAMFFGVGNIYRMFISCFWILRMLLDVFGSRRRFKLFIDFWVISGC